MTVPPWKLQLVAQADVAALRATAASELLPSAPSESMQRLSTMVTGSEVHVLDERTFMLVGHGGTELWDLPSARRLGRATHGGDTAPKVWRIDAGRVLVEVTPGQEPIPSELWLRDCGGLPPPTWQHPYYLDGNGGGAAAVLTDGSLLTELGFWRAGDGSRSELFDPAPRSPIFDRLEGALLVALDERQAVRVGGILVDPPVPETLMGDKLARALMAPARLFEAPPFAERPAPQLKAPRFGHTATALPGGSALITGGASFFGAARGFERWDPAARAFRSAGRLRAPRAGHTATLLQDGRVLLVGGCEVAIAKISDLRGVRVPVGVAATSAEIWQPEKAATADGGRLKTARCGHAAVRLADGRVLVIGGFERADGIVSAGHGAAGDGRLRSTEIFDPRTGRWSAGPDMRRGRVDASAVLLADGRVLVIGLENRDDGVAPTVEALSADHSAWHTVDRFAQTTGDERLIATADGRILMVSSAAVLELALP